MSDAVDKRREAERLLLLAEQAELEAEQLELAAKLLAPKRSESAEPVVEEREATPPADEEEDDEPMALRAPLRWIGQTAAADMAGYGRGYPAVALSFPQLQSPSQKARSLSGEPHESRPLRCLRRAAP